MNTYIILRRDHWNSAEDLQKAGARSSEVGAEMADRVSWIRTYALREASGKLGTVCVYQAVDEEALREHAACAKLPIDEVIPVPDVMVIRADPE